MNDLDQVTRGVNLKARMVANTLPLQSWNECPGA